MHETMHNSAKALSALPEILLEKTSILHSKQHLFSSVSRYAIDLIFNSNTDRDMTTIHQNLRHEIACI